MSWCRSEMENVCLLTWPWPWDPGAGVSSIGFYGCVLPVNAHLPPVGPLVWSEVRLTSRNPCLVPSPVVSLFIDIPDSWIGSPSRASTKPAPLPRLHLAGLHPGFAAAVVSYFGLFREPKKMPASINEIRESNNSSDLQLFRALGFRRPPLLPTASGSITPVRSHFTRSARMLGGDVAHQGTTDFIARLH